MAESSRTASASASSSSSPSATETQLAAALAALASSQTKIAELMERQTDYNEFAKQNAVRRRRTMAEYLAEKPRKRLLHEVYQNGRLVNPGGLSVETLRKLDTLATGKYADGAVDVIRVRDGINGVNSRIHIVYSNRSVEQRMAFYMKFPTFTDLVTAVVAEMAARGIAPVMDESVAASEPVFADAITATHAP